MKSNVKIVFVLMFLLLVASLPASASTVFEKSGDVVSNNGDSIFYNTVGGYTYFSSIPDLHNVYANYKMFYVNFDGNKYLSNIVIKEFFFSSTTVNQYARFTASIDGVYYGSGFIGFQNELYSPDKVNLIVRFNDLNYSYADTLSGVKRLELNTSLNSSGISLVYSYGDYIVTDSAQLDLLDDKVNGYVTVDRPVHMVCGYSWRYDDQYCIIGNLDGFRGSLNTYYISSYTNSINNYTYNRDTNGIATIDIYKGTYSSRWVLYNQSGVEYLNESTFNTNSIGTFLNVVNGTYADVYFNAPGGAIKKTFIIEPGLGDSSGGGSIPGSGSDGSTSIGTGTNNTNPLIDLDGDGDFTEADAKSLLLSLGPLMLILFLCIFVAVAIDGGKRK